MRTEGTRHDHRQPTKGEGYLAKRHQQLARLLLLLHQRRPEGSASHAGSLVEGSLVEGSLVAGSSVAGSSVEGSSAGCRLGCGSHHRWRW